MGTAFDVKAPFDTSGLENQANPLGEEDEGVSFVEESFLETPRGWAGLWSSQEGLPEGTVLRVHTLGAVVLMDATGDESWHRTGSSFFDDWEPIDPYVLPRVDLEADAWDPFSNGGEGAVAFGDLTGDGQAEVAIAHHAWGLDDEAWMGAVTILDQGTGETVWSQTYPQIATHLTVVDERLVVGLEGSDASSLKSLSFSEGMGTVDWLIEGHERAWLDLEPLNDGALAVANAVPDGTEGGEVWIVDEEGDKDIVATDAYPMTLRTDPILDVLVVHEQTFGARAMQHDIAGIVVDDAVAPGYQLRAFDLSTFDEEETLGLIQENRVLTSFQVNGVEHGAGWVVSDVRIDEPPVTQGVDGNENDVCAFPCEPVEGVMVLPLGAQASLASVPGDARVAAFDVEGSMMWEILSEDEAALGLTHEVAIVPAPGEDLVVVASDEGLLALTENKGEVFWAIMEPLSPGPFAVDRDEGWVLASSEQNVVHRLSLVDGGAEAFPLLMNPYQIAESVGTSGEDRFIVGTGSQGVFALNSPLVNPPSIAWSTLLGDRVFALDTGDVTGDGEEEIIAAAGDRLHVLDAHGDILDALSFDGSLVWTFTLSESATTVDILVPTEEVTRASWDVEDQSLEVSWSTPVLAEEDPISSVIEHEGSVYGHFSANVHHPFGWVRGQNQVSFALDSETGHIEWVNGFATGVGNWPYLMDSVALLEGQGIQGADAIAYVYRSTGDLVNPGEGTLGVRAHDADTGALLWSHAHLDGTRHMGQFVHDDRLVTYNGGTAVTATQESADPVHIGSRDATLVTIDGDELLLSTTPGLLSQEGTALRAWDANVLQGPYEPEEPHAVLERHAALQAINPVEESGDRATLLLTPFDYDAYGHILSLEGALLFHGNSWPEGIQTIHLFNEA